MNLCKNIAAVLFHIKNPTHFDMNKPIDLDLDFLMVSPSKDVFVHQFHLPNKYMEKLNTDGRNSPSRIERKTFRFMIEEIVIPEKI